jgi:hypothetical protein
LLLVIKLGIFVGLKHGPRALFYIFIKFDFRWRFGQDLGQIESALWLIALSIVIFIMYLSALAPDLRQTVDVFHGASYTSGFFRPFGHLLIEFLGLNFSR